MSRVPAFFTRVPGIVRDDANGSFSHTKFWSNVGNASITWVYIHDNMTGRADPLLMLTFGAIVAGSHIALKALGLWFAARNAALTAAPAPDNGSQITASPLPGGDQQ